MNFEKHGPTRTDDTTRSSNQALTRLTAASVHAVASCARLPLFAALALLLSASPAQADFSPAALQLKVLTATCGPDHRIDSFEITNTGVLPLSLADISVRYWAYDTTGLPLGAEVLWPGNISGGPPFRDWLQDLLIGDVQAKTTTFSPACGPDSTHQTNWEIQLSDTGCDVLLPGETWSNILVATQLKRHPSAPFAPGEGTWYSECVSGQEYTVDPHYAVYYDGELVFNGAAWAIG